MLFALLLKIGTCTKVWQPEIDQHVNSVFGFMKNWQRRQDLAAYCGTWLILSILFEFHTFFPISSDYTSYLCPYFVILSWTSQLKVRLLLSLCSLGMVIVHDIFTVMKGNATIYWYIDKKRLILKHKYTMLENGSSNM